MWVINILHVTFEPEGSKVAGGEVRGRKKKRGEREWTASPSLRLTPRNTKTLSRIWELSETVRVVG